MPTYPDIIAWVEHERGLRIHHPCWVAHCKAIALGYTHPELNERGTRRVQPCPTGAPRDAIMDAFKAIGVPNGKRSELTGAQK